MREVLRHRQVRAYLAAQILSIFGDTTLWLAVGVWVKQLTGSSSAAGLVFFFYTLPYAVAPVAGMLVDRLRRRPLLVGVNFASAVVVLVLLLVHDDHQVWLIYLVIFLYGVSGLLIGSGQSALLSSMLPERLLAEVNGVLQTGREGLRLVAPLLGAGVVAATGSAAPVAVFDAATFVAAAVVLLRLEIQEPRRLRADTHWWPELSAGARHVFATAALRHIVVATAVALLVLGFGETIVFPVAQQGLGRPPTFVGVLGSVMGVGALAGGLTAARAVRRLGDGPTLAVGLLIAAVGYLALATSSLPLVLAGVIVTGFGIPWAVVAFMTSLQTRTPQHLQGRAFSAADAAVTVPQTLSIALGAALVAVVDYRLLIVVVTVVSALAAGYLLTRRVEWKQPGPSGPAASIPAPAAAPSVTSRAQPGIGVTLER
jgi:MFS family permease